MKTKHLILRGHAAPARTTRGPMADAAVAAAPLESLRVDVDELDPRGEALLRRDSGVVAVAPAMPMKLVEPRDVGPATPADAGAVAWGVKAVRADQSPRTGAGVVVAVLDTGIVATHPAFTGVDIVGRNFTTEAAGDLHGHGTHCAGTIFGRAVDGTRIGVAPGITRALIGKVLGAGGGSSEGIVDAMLWAADQGADVISMSLGIDFPGYARALREGGMPEELAVSRALEGYRTNVALFERLIALLNARTRPTVVVAAAGNESDRENNPDFEIGVSPPAVSPGIVSVAALGRRPDGKLGVAGFSNTGASVSGPGVGIVSAGLGRGLASMSGTSMATPHVAGVAALWAELLRSRGQLTALNLTGRLIGQAGLGGLAADIDPADIGAGLVVAPQE